MKKGGRKRENYAFRCEYVRRAYVCICSVLYCIIFIILIDIQQKICSCTIFHIVYLRNINQFEICMLLFMLNNESFSYSIICSPLSNPLFFDYVPFQFNTLTKRTHTYACTQLSLWMLVRAYISCMCHNMVALFPVARSICCLLYAMHERMNFTAIERYKTAWYLIDTHLIYTTNFLFLFYLNGFFLIWNRNVVYIVLYRLHSMVMTVVVVRGNKNKIFWKLKTITSQWDVWIFSFGFTKSTSFEDA